MPPQGNAETPERVRLGPSIREVAIVHPYLLTSFGSKLIFIRDRR
jgi:hypothetical protein